MKIKKGKRGRKEVTESKTSEGYGMETLLCPGKKPKQSLVVISLHKYTSRLGHRSRDKKKKKNKKMNLCIFGREGSTKG